MRLYIEADFVATPNECQLSRASCGALKGRTARLCFAAVNSGNEKVASWNLIRTLIVCVSPCGDCVLDAASSDWIVEPPIEMCHRHFRHARSFKSNPVPN